MKLEYSVLGLYFVKVLLIIEGRSKIGAALVIYRFEEIFAFSNLASVYLFATTSARTIL